MTLKRFFLCLLTLLTVCLPALAAVSVIQPTDDFYVNDAANVLSDATEGHIILNNDALYDACGAQIVFVTLDTVTSTTLENYAYTLYENWGIGKDGRGILVLMTIKDDDYWVVPGVGLQDYITAGDLDEMVLNDLEPYFAAKDYDAGAKTFFNALFAAVARALNVNLAVDDTLYDQYIAQFDSESTGNDAAELIKKHKTGQSDRDSLMPRTNEQDDSGHPLLGFIILVVIILLIANSRRRSKIRRYSGTQTVYRSRPVVTPVILPHTSRPPTRSFGSSFGSSRSSYGGSRSSFGSSRSSFGSSHSSFGGSHSSFGSSHSSRPSGFGGGRSGGGGHTRGGGVGRHR